MEDPMWPIAIYGETDPLCFTSNRGTGPPKWVLLLEVKMAYNIIQYHITWDYMGLYGLIYIYISLSTHIIPYNFGLRMFSFFFFSALDPEFCVEILELSFSNFPEWLN